MPRKIFRLSYMSTATETFSAPTLAALETRADSRNRARDITGALLFDSVNFYQVLEGAEEDVITLMDSITRDRRHGGIIYLESGEQARRIFIDWGMRLLSFPQLSRLLDQSALGQLPAKLREAVALHTPS